MTQPQINNEWIDVVEDAEAFWNEETSPVVQGRVSAITTMVLARRETEVAILTLTAPCVGVRGSKDDKTEVKLLPGQTIGVVIKHKLQSLYSMLEHQCEVQIKAKGKQDLDNGNTLWTYAIRSRGQRSLPSARPARPAASRHSASAADDSLDQF